MNVTLESIRAEQIRLSEMIATLEAQAKVAHVVCIPEASIKLNDAEHYAGIILGKDGAPNYHLILLPGEAESVTWHDAKQRAAKVGGELPTRREQSLLYSNLKEQFQSAWYWSCEQHASYGDFAWVQFFGNGYQDFYPKRNVFRARAVRRLEIL